MHFGLIKGTVVASQKVSTLEGLSLKVLVPCDRTGKVLGSPVVAVDDVGSRPGDRVLWVAKREASMAIRDAPVANAYPVDAAVTGIIDDLG